MAKSITLKANAKINIGLFIKGKRPDGYHEIETVYYPVFDLFDTVTVMELAPDEETNMYAQGLPIPGDSNENLCLKAYQLLKDEFPTLPPVRIHLIKKIAVGSGLGGGSSDAAAVLSALNQLFELHLSKEELEKRGVKLGADVPFFFENRPILARGIGDKFFEIELNIPYKIEVITPPVQSDTVIAYKEIDLSKCSIHKNLEKLITVDVSKWKDYITNDFESTVFRRFPEIAKLKQYLYKKGALYASMSGSGSAIYGIFR